jgi:hypothetical protein
MDCSSKELETQVLSYQVLGLIVLEDLLQQEELLVVVV